MYLARVFDNPSKVFTPEILQPERQDLDSFADGVLHIAEAQQRVAARYFKDGSFELACPPLRAVLSVMAHGEYEGKSISDPEVRELFTRDALLSSDWYRRRLEARRDREVDHWRFFERRLENYLNDPSHHEVAEELGLKERLAYAQSQLAQVREPGYLDRLVGTLGADPMQPSLSDPKMINRLAGV
jgi:hypothetical protein